MLNFQGLENKYGSPAAFDLLLQMEKIAHIQSWAMVALDFETRLANAIRAQDLLGQMPMLLAA